MNYPTLKKVVAFSMLVLGLTVVAQAQESVTTTSTPTKTFGGSSQYRTWSLGVNAGALTPRTILGDSNPDYAHADLNLGYGLTLRKRLGSTFGLEADVLKGKLSGSNSLPLDAGQNKTFRTTLDWTASLLGVVNLASADFNKGEKGAILLAKFGYGFASYKHTTTDAASVVTTDNTKHKDAFIPVGLDAKFKVNNRLNFDLGYNMYFMTKSDELDGAVAGGKKDKFSYVYAGLEFPLGSASKPNRDWDNPVTVTYDELKETVIEKKVDTLVKKVDTLENRVTTLESEDLLKDSDADGVADKLDKCPNTEAGVKVDGTGCPLDSDGDGVPDSKDNCPNEKGTVELNGCPAPVVSVTGAIQFEFNSSVLKTEAYAALDELSTELRSGAVKTVSLEGHASDEGTAEYNMQLSKDRANSVKTYLVNSGIAANRLLTKGFGETRPVASNATEEGREMNRRVEIVKQ